MMRNWRSPDSPEPHEFYVDFEVAVEVSAETQDANGRPMRSVHGHISKVEESEDGEIPFLITECMEAAAQAVWDVVKRHYSVTTPS